MFYRQTQQIIENLLRFKIDGKTTEQKTINLIGSYEDSINIPGIKVTSKQKQKGEVAELKSLLSLYYR